MTKRNSSKDQAQQINTFSLRPATTDDVDAVVKIENLSYKRPWTEGHFSEEVDKKGSYFLVYTDDETDEVVAGYIVFRDLGQETQILNIVVALEWRGLGMATRLLRFAINEAHRLNHKRVFLEVRTSNDAAIKLYNKIGFIDGGIRRKFYEDGEDARMYYLSIESKNPVEQVSDEPENKDNITYH